MFKFRRWVCLALVCAMVGVAYGAARKISAFHIQLCGGTPCEPAGADGMAILNFANSSPDGKTITHLAITGFTPFRTYDVEFRSRTRGSTFGPGILVTDERGDAFFNGPVTSGDVSDSDIYIYVNMGTAAIELRTVGLQ